MVHDPFESVLIVSRDEENARRDKRSLMRFSQAKILTFTSGADAFDFLCLQPVSLVLCDTMLSDMSGVRFVKLLRKNMNLSRLPVVIVTMDNRKETVLDAIGAGCTGYILRPYSQETFERHVKLAGNVERVNEIEEIKLDEARNMVSMGDFDEAIEAFEELIAVQDEAQKYYDQGCDYLLRGKYGQAIIAFKKAIRVNELFAEAYKGLAEAYKGKGDLDNHAAYLQKAAEIHAQFDRLEEAKALFLEVLKHVKGAPNPYNTWGVKLRKEGDYVGALHAYRQALKLTPKDPHVFFNIAKAYYFTGETEKCREYLDKSLSLQPEFTEAAGFYEKMTGESWTGVAGTDQTPTDATTDTMVDDEP